MTPTARQGIELVEYGPPLSLERDQLSEADAHRLYQEHRDKVDVQYPTPRTGGKWQLSAFGWVGYIPLFDGLGVRLSPRVPLANLFAMLEVAYRLGSFRFLSGIASCSTLNEYYDRLANLLASRVLDRCRRGLYRSYVRRAEPLPYVRGRLDIGQHTRRPARLTLPCRFEEQTADTPDNRILLWALRTIVRNAACGERARPNVRRACRALQGSVALERFGPDACTGRPYNRLNDDYRVLHALCRFFLESSGPSHERGDRRMLPFLVNMPRLFELFVAEWLRAHLPGDVILRAQEPVALAPHLRFDIDLTLADATGRPVCVIDTKYKIGESPSTDDVAQVVAYAEAKGCTEAALVYPIHLRRSLDAHVGRIRVRSLDFPLGGDLDEAGSCLLAALTGDRITA